MASFIGNIGAKMFFQVKEGENSPTVLEIDRQINDDKLFSNFLKIETDIFFQKKS